jgi:pyruvate formate lyase activating enzyme
LKEQALIFDVKRDCSEDGPGIRSTVFFKGCPLSCLWCQNPEGIDPEPGLSFNRKSCCASVCGYLCLTVCHTGALLQDHLLQVEHELCNRCDRCFSPCPTKALEPVGRWVTVEELLYEVYVDKPFFSSTGGGVTLSGGEPTLQMSFIGCFLKALKEENIDTAIETCGFFNYEYFRGQVLPFLDLIYFDIKLISDSESRRYTGRSNRLIIENFSRLIKESNIPVIPRIPLIPEITNTFENLRGIAEFLKINGVSNCSLMPYNPLWVDKLKRLGLKARYKRTSFMTKEEEDACINYFFDAEKPELQTVYSEIK